MPNRVLDINDLHVSFDTYAGEVKAVRGVTLHVDEGEVLAIVGESGCGKSVTAQTIMKLNPMPPARIVSGSIQLGEHDIVAASEKQMQAIRGKEVSMIFQDPMTCMNPTTPVGKQIVEAIKLHKKLSKKEAAEEAIRCLKQVNIPNPEERAKQYPHEFSGGMRQRAMIAMALSCNPKLLIADEPTTALDVTIQAQIMDLLVELKEQINTAIILITHDLGVVAGVADRVAVMYAGKVVETGTDDKWGPVVAIEDASGRVWRVCGTTDARVKKGDTVSAGQTIGKVGSVSCECAEESHIHLEVMEGEKYLDPIKAMK